MDDPLGAKLAHFFILNALQDSLAYFVLLQRDLRFAALRCAHIKERLNLLIISVKVTGNLTGITIHARIA
jgi:hypothetical protein